MTYPNPPTDPDLRLILDAYYNAPCPRCGRTEPCRCLREGEDRYFRFRAILDGLAAAGRLLPPPIAEVTRWRAVLPQGVVKGIAEQDARHLAATVGGTVDRSTVILHTDGTEVLHPWTAAPTPTTGQPDSPWAEPGDPCADCKCPKDWHRNGVGPCTGDFMHCPCRAYQPPTRPQED